MRILRDEQPEKNDADEASAQHHLAAVEPLRGHLHHDAHGGEQKGAEHHPERLHY
jgi:hypothetical protein